MTSFSDLTSLSNNQQNIHDLSRHWEKTFCNANNLTVLAFWKGGFGRNLFKICLFPKSQGNYMESNKTFFWTLLIIATRRTQTFMVVLQTAREKCLWRIVAEKTDVFIIHILEVATGGVQLKKVFLESLQNSQENACASLFLLKKRLWHRFFLWILRNF